MNAHANARQSRIVQQLNGTPLLRASDYCGGEAQTRALLLFATFPNHAPMIVDALETNAKTHRLDGALSKALHVARKTVGRAQRKASAARMH